MNRPPRPRHAAEIDDDFLRTFEHLAQGSAPDIARHLPEIAGQALHHHLVALGMAATVIIQGHIQSLADQRYRLVVRSGADHAVSLLVVDPNTGNGSGISLHLIWNEVLYASPDHGALRPETASLLREHVASALYDEDGETITGFYATLRETFTAEPYVNVLRRIAHLPVMLHHVEAEGKYGGQRSVERETQRRLAQLYNQHEEIDVHLGSEPAMNA